MTGPTASRRSFVTHRPVAVLMVFTAAVVFGFFSLRRIPVTLMPELTYPTLTVRTEYTGSAPQEVENEISRPIEEALGVLAGLKRLTSVSRAGLSDVTLEFLWGTDMSKAAQEALEKLDLVFLPREAERPLILRFDPALDPILELSLSGEGSRYEGEQGLRRLRRLADLQVKRALEPIPGVAAVRVRGGLEEEYQVLLRKDAMDRTGIAVQTVIDRLRQENINVAGGTLKEGRTEYMVRALNEYENLEQIAETVVVRRDGREIRVKDLGSVVRSHKEREMLTRTQGAESVQIDIYKEADANIVAVARAVRGAVGEGAGLEEGVKRGGGKGGGDGSMKLGRRLRELEGARLRVVADRSGFIEGSIREVRDAAVYGGVLAVLVLYLFLRDFRTTAIIGVSIPMSLGITFAPLHLLGVSLNLMSLGGLALGVGMLVDNSIVVLESIYRCREEGDDLVSAAIRGTAEVRGAVVASTLTTVAVFLPMVFVEGIAGQVFGDLSMAVVTALSASLAVAVWFVPMLASRVGVVRSGVGVGAGDGESLRGWGWGGGLAAWRGSCFAGGGWRRVWERWWWLPWEVLRLVVGVVLEVVGRLLMAVGAGLGWMLVRWVGPGLAWVVRVGLGGPCRWVGGVVGWMQERYAGWIRGALAHPVWVMAGVGLCLWLTWQVGRRLETELLPEVHQGEFTVEVDLPVGTPLEGTVAALTAMEAVIRDDSPEVETVLAAYGFDATNIKRSDEGENTARFKVVLRPGGDPVGVEERVLGRVRERFAGIPDASVRVVKPVLFSAERPIVVELQGDDLTELREVSERVREALAGLPGLADVEATLRRGAPEIQVVYHRDRLALYGLNIGAVARQVRDLVQGNEATRFNMKDRRIPVRVRLEEGDRAQVEDVGRLLVDVGGDRGIPLSSVAALEVGEGPSEIRRVDGQRVAVIRAGVGEGTLGGAVEGIRSVLGGGVRLPAGVGYAIRGQNEEWERSRGSLLLALGLSLFLVYVVMASQFESLVQPLIIMASIPLAFFGSAMGLAVTGTAISVVVFLGLIVLAGIVVNNAIVLVDCANQNRARGMEAGEAVAAAGRVRLRPILLTTGTTVLGLMPMALGLGEGAEIRTPLALTVMFGLASSTLLTLVVIPVVYAVTVRWQARWFGGWEEDMGDGRAN